MLISLKKSVFTLLVFSLLIVPVAFLSACGGRSSFSLADSRASRSISECMAEGKKKRYDKAIDCLQAYKSYAPDVESSALVDLAIADMTFLKKDYLVAAELYNGFIQEHPAHSKVPYAYYKSGLSYFNEAPKSIDRDQTHLDNAVKALGAVVNYYPNSPYASNAKEAYDQSLARVAKKHFYIGRFYYKYKEYLAAIPRFETVVADFTNLGLDEKSFYYLISALKKTRQDDLAMRYFDVFKNHYPNSSYVKRIARLF